MRCPFCGDDTSRVVDTREARDGEEIRRRRECEECGRRFTTRERTELVLPRIIKHDERREDFQREKLLTAVQKACEKRPISAEALDRLVDRLVHNAEILTFKGQSWRFKEAQERAAQRTKERAARRQARRKRSPSTTTARKQP